MANPITEAIENLNKNIHDLQKTNDQSLEEQKKGNEVRFRELQEKCDKQESMITELTKARNDAIRSHALVNDRVELLEAMADRPKGNIVKKLYEEDEQLFLKWVRSGFTDRQAISARDDIARKAIELKVDTVTAGTALLGGNAVPKVISDQVERLVLKTSEVVEAIGIKTVGTSDCHDLWQCCLVGCGTRFPLAGQRAEHANHQADAGRTLRVSVRVEGVSPGPDVQRG
jgi:HK97 family phage major capsid protein